jgi:hypothetical protein
MLYHQEYTHSYRAIFWGGKGVQYDTLLQIRMTRNELFILLHFTAAFLTNTTKLM